MYSTLQMRKLTLLCTVSVVCTGLVYAFAQSIVGTKIIKANDPAQITDAVMITDVSVAGSSVQCGLFVKPPSILQSIVPFQAANEWLKQLTVSLFNRTDRTIVSGALTLVFLATGDCKRQACSAAELHLGQMPVIDAYDGRTGEPLQQNHPEIPPLEWNPHTKITVKISDYADAVEHELAGHLAPTAVSQIAIHIGPFFFKDGLRWASPGYAVPDSEHHGKFRTFPLNYFPGRRNVDWPPGYDR